MARPYARSAQLEAAAHALASLCLQGVASLQAGRKNRRVRTSALAIQVMFFVTIFAGAGIAPATAAGLPVTTETRTPVPDPPAVKSDPPVYLHNVQAGTPAPPLPTPTLKTAEVDVPTCTSGKA
jgi:hypothetical protein